MKNLNIKVYSKNNCQQCNFAKLRLDEFNVPYTEINIEEPENLKYLRMLKEMDYRSMPVIMADGIKSISGFQIDQIDKLIAEVMA